MSANLIEALQSLVTPALLKTASSTLGESEGALTSGLGAIVSKILSALVSGSGDQSLMNMVAGLVSSQARDPGALADIAGLLTSGTASIPGSQLLGSLFGVKQGGFAQAAAAAAGLKPQSGASLMALAAPLVLGGLGKAPGATSLSGAALSSMLAAQRASLLGSLTPAASAAAAAASTTAAGAPAVQQAVAAAPAATATAAAQTTVKQAAPAATPQVAAAASTATAAASTAARTAEAVTKSAPVAAEREGAGIAWLVWPVLLLALAGIGYFLWETKYSELKSSPPAAAPAAVEETKPAPKVEPVP